MRQSTHKPFIKLAVICGLLMAGSVVGHAASFTSVQSGNWDDPMTWGTATVPGAADNVTISNGHTVTIFFFSHPVNNLTIDNGGVFSRTIRAVDNRGRRIVSGPVGAIE